MPTPKLPNFQITTATKEFDDEDVNVNVVANFVKADSGYTPKRARISVFSFPNEPRIKKYDFAAAALQDGEFEAEDTFNDPESPPTFVIVELLSIKDDDNTRHRIKKKVVLSLET